MRKSYFYTIEGKNGRPGYGITTDIDDRARDYTSHQGDIAVMPKVWKGPPEHISSLENTFKRDKRNAWIVESGTIKSGTKTWKTEWMNDDWTMDMLIKRIEETIDYRFPQIELAYTKYDITD